jgi:hypothetical protein
MTASSAAIERVVVDLPREAVAAEPPAKPRVLFEVPQEVKPLERDA